jgi:hypothetical protein
MDTAGWYNSEGYSKEFEKKSRGIFGLGYSRGELVMDTQEE